MEKKGLQHEAPQALFIGAWDENRTRTEQSPEGF